MFNITSDMLLESSDTIIGSGLSHSKVTGESYFITGLEKVHEMAREYNLVKAGLYSAITESSTDEFKSFFSDAYERSFPKKQDITKVAAPVSEAVDSTTAFVRYFGDSIQILNKAVGNIADAANGIKNQVPVQKLVSSKIIEACEQAKSDCHCPICGTSPCTCKNISEKVFKYDTERDIPFTRIDFSIIEKGLEPGTDFGKAYDSTVAEIKESCSKYRSELCGLEESVNISRSGFNGNILNSFRSSGRYDVKINKKYLDYCVESVLGFDDKVDGLVKECKSIARKVSESVSGIESIKNAASTMRYIKEDGSYDDIDGDKVQDMCLAGKDKVEEMISKISDLLTGLYAKIDSIQSEFNQCKAVVSKYVLGNDQPIMLPDASSDDDSTDDDVTDMVPDVSTTDGMQSPSAPISEEPDTGCEGEDDDDDECGEGCYNNEEDDEFGAVGDLGDIIVAAANDTEETPYGESLIAFAMDTIIEEARFNEYVNTLLGEPVAVNEGVVGGIKTAIQSIMKFLKNMWGKFTNSMASIFENEQKYLAANKNIILGYKPKSANIENWYNYDVDKINNVKLEEINRKLEVLSSATVAATDVSVSGEIAKCADPKDGINETFATYFKEFDNAKYANTVDKFKAYYTGDPVTINAANLSIQDIQKMYDYCYNFNDKTKPVLDKEKEAINSMYDKAIKSANMLEQNVPTQQQPQESTDMSSVFDKYFSEEGMKISKPDEDPNAAKDGGASNAVNSPDTQQQQNIADKEKAGVGDDVTKKNVDTIKAYYTNVFKMMQTFVGARLTVAESAFRDYMKFMRWHVGQYAGQVTKADKQGDVITNGGKAGQSAANDADAKL